MRSGRRRRPGQRSTEGQVEGLPGNSRPALGDVAPPAHVVPVASRARDKTRRTLTLSSTTRILSGRPFLHSNRDSLRFLRPRL